MIPLATITAWSNAAPWIDPHFIEQDLILCRALIEMFNNNFLAENLAFRGGTAIHKLYLSPQMRYSEDIDFVQVEPKPIGETLNHIREALSFIGTPIIKQKHRNNTLIYRYDAEALPRVTMRLKIEINCQEHLNVHGLVAVPFEIRNMWFSGRCDVVTYTLDELVGTKIRALYQRKKGRDLFDAYHALVGGKLDVGRSIFCYKKYMEHSNGYVPSATQYLENLSGKMKDTLFRADMEPLLRSGARYDIQEAFEAFRKQFIEAM
jgi:predicted nucleotidyltransferase component of viral defense system